MNGTKIKTSKGLSISEALNLIEEINNSLEACRKCGKCQSVCPVFRETGFEGHASRGKIFLLKGLRDNILFNTRKIEKSLRYCLLCGKCASACPSKIDTKLLFLKARLLMKDFDKKSFIKKYLIYVFVKMPGLQAFFLKSRKTNKLSQQSKTKVETLKPKEKVVFFSGCLFDKVFADKTAKALKIIEKLGYDTSLVSKECCGMPFLTSGNLNEFKKARSKLFQKLVNESPSYIVSGCPTCISAIKDIWPGFSESLNSEFDHKVKILDFHQFIYEKTKNIHINQESKKYKKIKWHMPCHLKSLCGLGEPEFLIEKFSGHKIEKDSKLNSCCGFGGTFSLDHPIMSGSILSKKAADLDLKDDEVLFTGCPACMMQLGRISFPKRNKIFHTIDLIADNIDYL